jgi:Protein of unknown function (DUF4233)
VRFTGASTALPGVQPLATRRVKRVPSTDQTPRLPLYGVAGRLTRRLAAIVIGSQGLAVFFGALVARSIASSGGTSGTASGSARAYLLLGSAFALVCFLDAGLLRRPWGVTLGWLLQLATLAAGIVVRQMLIVGVVFLALWVTALVQGRKLDDLAAQAAAATGPT